MQPRGMRRVMQGEGGAREIQDSPDAICMILTFLHLLHPPRIPFYRTLAMRPFHVPSYFTFRITSYYMQFFSIPRHARCVRAETVT